MCSRKNEANITKVNFFLVQRGRSVLAGLTLSQDNLKLNLEGVIQTISTNESTAAFWRWMDCGEKYVCFSSNWADKYPEINKFLKGFVFKLSSSADWIPITSRK
jgi:hypothetical protein